MYFLSRGNLLYQFSLELSYRRRTGMLVVTGALLCGGAFMAL